MTFPAPALFALLLFAGPQDPLYHGAFDGPPGPGPQGWFPNAPSASDTAHDSEEGRAAPGSLRISNTDPDDDTLRMWSFSLPLGDERPGRLRLSAAVRGQSLTSGTQAQLMAQLWPREGDCLSYPRTVLVESDCDWTATDVVFDVPPETARVRLLFYLKGVGTVWLDDVTLTPTKDAATHYAPPVAPRNDPAIERLARGAANEIRWIFDGETAREKAAAEGKPVLLYVRCTDAKDGAAALSSVLDAPSLPLQEDGVFKDVLFRAGPLSTPRIAEFISEHFVPACATYMLATSRAQRTSVAGWNPLSGGVGADLAWAADEGAAATGCLQIHTTLEGPLRMWEQRIEWNGEAHELTLGASMKAAHLPRGGEVNVMLQCWSGQQALAYARLKPILSRARPGSGGLSCDWRSDEVEFDVPAGVDTIRVLAYLKGEGTASFDDLSLRRTGTGDNLLINGNLSAGLVESARLAGFAVDPGRVTTPALCVFDAAGALVAKLDRHGALSDELVIGLLERALEAADPGDGSRRVASPVKPLKAAVKLLRAGQWARAAKHLDSVGERAGEEGRFLRALCAHRLGDHEVARELWTGLLSETAWGRKAAACLLVAGPRLHEVMTVRAWPESSSLFVTTEDSGGDFDVERSVLALLELQRADGSFGSQIGAEGLGWNDPAITAIAVDGLEASSRSLSTRLRKRVKQAVTAANGALLRYAAEQGRPSQRTAAFNNPYVLATLLHLGEETAVKAIVEHICAGQEPDGNWTVYGPQRPASFNTGQNTMALMAARAAKIDVPEGAIQRGLDALEAMRDAAGLFPYSSAAGHEWMTTEHGAIGRDPLCEHALLMGGRGSVPALNAALERFLRHGVELREPTKRLYDYFNSRGHGGYFFFFSHRCALEAAAAHGDSSLLSGVEDYVRLQVLDAQEGDGTFVDQFNLGRSYGTAQALFLLSKRTR